MMNGTSLNEPVKRIAAIDLGTNSFHSVIVDLYRDGSFYTVDRLKEMVLLGDSGLGQNISDAAMMRGIEALKKIALLARSRNAETILAFATSAIREAANGGEFIQRALDEAGVKVNAIPGRLEAELIGLAVQNSVSMPETPAMIMDIGGGSVEFLIADQQKFYYLNSKKLGVARMTRTFIENDPVTLDEADRLTRFYERELRDEAEAFAMNRSNTLIGSSGTMENIARMISYRNNQSPDLSLNELEFSADDFFSFYDDVIGMNFNERLKLKGLDEKRVSMIPAGLILVHYVLKTFGIQQVIISTQALREGIILQYIRNHLDRAAQVGIVRDPRRKSVMELVFRCDWKENHSRHVAKMALILFDALAELLELGSDDRELLEYSALMHDIGYHISYRQHHKHALYLIRNADLRGFKEVEVELMANIARYHRRSEPKLSHPYFKKLTKNNRERVKKLSAILRVADGLDRSHYQNVQNLTTSMNASRMILQIETESDPNLEIWGAMRKKELLEEEIRRQLEIVTV
jgi:exopolyphosphatase / guanosine-5'-triphosphate,3'-diphosphate pyrophosphatase